MICLLTEVEFVLDARATLGEGPCWNPELQSLYWVDIIENKVCIFDPKMNKNREIQFEQHVSAVVPKSWNKAVVTLEDGFYELHLQTETLSLIREIESRFPNNRFNDGKCDAYGRFWAGTMNKVNPHEKQGALYCLDTDRTVTMKLNKVGISNGIAWSKDNQYMYYIDTLTQKVVRYRFHIQFGEIEHPVEIISFAEEEGFPDGMTIDEEGMLWIAHWGGSKVSRWNPDSGEKLTAIDVPALNVTSCTFGGPDLSDLYVTTARDGMNESQLEKYPYSGGLFKIKTGVKGTSACFYKG